MPDSLSSTTSPIGIIILPGTSRTTATKLWAPPSAKRSMTPGTTGCPRSVVLELLIPIRTHRPPTGPT